MKYHLMKFKNLSVIQTVHHRLSNPSYIVMDGFSWVYNGTGNDVSGAGRFRHTAVNQPLDELERDLPDKTFKNGQTYSYSTSDWGTDFNYYCGTLTEENPWKCNAYLRIKAHQEKTDDWLAEANNTFNHLDVR